VPSSTGKGRHSLKSFGPPTSRAFDQEGTAVLTLHVYSEREDAFFNNGGKKWTSEGRKMKFAVEGVPI
jgi:hypothetical protein